MGRTTEVSADWSSICDIYENALRRLRAEVPDITVAGGHSSHSYINGTNMYFIYYYNVNCPPEQEVAKYRTEINRDHLRGDAEARRLGGPPPRHGQGTHAVGQGGIRLAPTTSLERLKRAFDPNDIMNKGTIIPELTGPTMRSTQFVAERGGVLRADARGIEAELQPQAVEKRGEAVDGEPEVHGRAAARLREVGSSRPSTSL